MFGCDGGTSRTVRPESSDCGMKSCGFLRRLAAAGETLNFNTVRIFLQWGKQVKSFKKKTQKTKTAG